MGSNLPMPKKIDYVLLISLLSLCTFATLFIFRTIDDNSLTRWQWTFANADITLIYPLFILGIILAYMTSKVSLPERILAPFLFISSFFITASFWQEPEVIVWRAGFIVGAVRIDKQWLSIDVCVALVIVQALYEGIAHRGELIRDVADLTRFPPA